VKLALDGRVIKPFDFNAILPAEIANLSNMERRYQQIPMPDPKLVKEVIRRGLSAEGVSV
jgi:hypothetical protein